MAYGTARTCSLKEEPFCSFLQLPPSVTEVTMPGINPKATSSRNSGMAEQCIQQPNALTEQPIERLPLRALLVTGPLYWLSPRTCAAPPNTEWNGKNVRTFFWLCPELDVPHSSPTGALEIAKLEDQPIMKHKESPGSNGAPSQSPRPRVAKKMDAILVTKLQKEGFSSSFMAPCENPCLNHWHRGRLLGKG